MREGAGEDGHSDSCTTGMPMLCRICSGDSSTIWSGRSDC